MLTWTVDLKNHEAWSEMRWGRGGGAGGGKTSEVTAIDGLGGFWCVLSGMGAAGQGLWSLSGPEGPSLGIARKAVLSASCQALLSAFGWPSNCSPNSQILPGKGCPLLSLFLLPVFSVTEQE